MKTLMLGLCAAAMFTGQASAEPLTLTTTRVDNGWQQVRRHCDQRGRCWEENWRNPLLESYGFAPLPAPRADAGAPKRPGPSAKG
jgi:hypothetical protein